MNLNELQSDISKIGSLTGSFGNHLSNLGDAYQRLLKIELKEQREKLAAGLVFFGTTVAFALSSLVLLGFALADFLVRLALGLSHGSALAVTGSVFLLFAVGSGTIAIKKLQDFSRIPHQTLRSLKATLLSFTRFQ
jgi:uncharacterized membrane protein YqjE